MRRVWHLAREVLRRYFVAGILVFAPIGVTIWAIAWIIQRLDNLILPHLLRVVLPGLEHPPRLPVVGALFTLVVIILIGVVARHLFGAEVVRVWERLLRRVPVARSIYGAVKQLVEALFTATTRENFRRVVMIEYPRKGLYALAFTTGPARGLLQDVTDERMINCFVPTNDQLLRPDHSQSHLRLLPARPRARRHFGRPHRRGRLQAGDVGGTRDPGRGGRRDCAAGATVGCARARAQPALACAPSSRYAARGDA
jgi:uncharacterized membrane protein